MPTVRFADGRSFNFDVVNAQQIRTDHNFNHSKQSATAYFVVGIDDEEIPATPIIIGDTHSIWLQHQEQVITSGKKPNKHTFLNIDEASRARELFNRIIQLGMRQNQLQNIIPSGRQEVEKNLTRPDSIAVYGQDLPPQKNAVVSEKDNNITIILPSNESTFSRIIYWIKANWLGLIILLIFCGLITLVFTRNWDIISAWSQNHSGVIAAGVTITVLSGFISKHSKIKT